MNQATANLQSGFILLSASSGNTLDKNQATGNGFSGFVLKARARTS